MIEARGYSLILYKISHFLTFDLDFDLFGPTFFFGTKLLSTHRGSINKIGWSKFKFGGGTYFTLALAWTIHPSDEIVFIIAYHDLQTTTHQLSSEAQTR